MAASSSGRSSMENLTFSFAQASDQVADPHILCVQVDRDPDAPPKERPEH
jgi:hypothetical protein